MSFTYTTHELDNVIKFSLIATEKRLTLDIHHMASNLIYHGEDDGNYYKFIASNGYEIYSRSRMDIQTERIWLLGASKETRSGTMVFSSNEKRDAAFDKTLRAMIEWTNYVRDDKTRLQWLNLEVE